MVEGRNPLASYLRSCERTIATQSNTKPVKIKLLRQAWNAFARLLDIDWYESFQCPLCGPCPEVVRVVAQAGERRVAQAGEQRVVAQAGERRVVTQAGERRVVAQAGQRTVMAQAGEWRVVAQAGERRVVTQAGERRAVTQAGERRVAQAGERRVVEQAGERRVVVQAGAQRVVAQAGEQRVRHRLQIYGTRGVGVVPFCLQMVTFTLPFPIGSLLSLPVHS